MAEAKGRPGEAGTVYRGPVITTDLTVGGRELRLVRPGDPDRMLDDPGVLAWNRRDDYMPYWAYIWPGTFLLAEAVAREPLEAGGSALEIGCGLGLAGLAALGRGLHVTFSDYDPAPLKFAERSALSNGFEPASFTARTIDWRDPPAEPFGLILGADVLYERRLVPLVANVLAVMLAPGGLGLIADPYRASAEGFPAALASHGLDGTPEPVTAESTELGPVRGTLYRVTRRG